MYYIDCKLFITNNVVVFHILAYTLITRMVLRAKCGGPGLYTNISNYIMYITCNTGIEYSFDTAHQPLLYNLFCCTALYLKND